MCLVLPDLQLQWWKEAGSAVLPERLRLAEQGGQAVPAVLPLCCKSRNLGKLNQA